MIVWENMYESYGIFVNFFFHGHYIKLTIRHCKLVYRIRQLKSNVKTTSLRIWFTAYEFCGWIDEWNFSHICATVENRTHMTLSRILSHCGLVAPYGVIKLSPRWFREWLAKWQHLNFSSARSIDIHHRTVNFTRGTSAINPCNN